MDWRELFAMYHTHVQDQYRDLVLRELTEDDVRVVPLPGQNSIAWLFWHMTRCEDVAVNIVLSRRGEVLEDGWTGRMGVDRLDIGTGMTIEEVATLSANVDFGALLAYRAAVAARTREVVGQLDERDLEGQMTDLEVSGLHERGLFGDHAGWVGTFWAPKPRRWFLWLPTGHCYHHMGEAITVRSLAGHRIDEEAPFRSARPVAARTAS